MTFPIFHATCTPCLDQAYISL